jgi:hypothetical protein
MRLLIFSFLIGCFIAPVSASAQGTKPKCEGADISKWNGCVGEWQSSMRSVYVGEFVDGERTGQGSISFTDGSKYVGEFKNGSYDGFGVIFTVGGNKTKEGLWRNGVFVREENLSKIQEARAALVALERKVSLDKEFKQILEGINSGSSQSNWVERINFAVSTYLINWMQGQSSAVFPEVKLPEFPPSLKLTQEKWESNKEFEEKIVTSRVERQKEIDRIQSSYKNQVDKRNSEIKKIEQLRIDKEKQLPSKRNELLNYALQSIRLTIEAQSASFDQEIGVLYLDISIDKQKSEKFAYKDTSQQARRDALISPNSLVLKPEFFVRDSGQFGIKAINIESGGVKFAGTPTQDSAGSQALRFATIDLPVSNLPVLTQQSAITVDKNQVEQILYRDENESLRKRLDEQRKAQELALSEQARRVEQETAKFKAEADAAKRRQQELEQQLAQSSGNKSQINYGRALNAHALVIGNSAYGGSAKLPNPQNDAKLIAKKLRELGFKVTEVVDADRSKLVSSLSTFSATAQSADLTMLFYAGHGVQISGTNYMLPVDLNMNDLSQVPLQGVSLSSVVEQYLPGKTKLVFLDACRDNPLMQTASRSVSRGLAPINVSEGTLISYSTKDGQVAQDGEGKNSPFTKALLDHLDDPEDIAVVLRKVREQVMKNTGGKQQPWEYGSLTGGSLVLSAIKQK